MNPQYMQRALELAALAEGHTGTNPMVGAVVVHGDRVIGEGYHQAYGGPHAEVNAISSVKNTRDLLESTMYVSLEPCSHQGKTPPCVDLIKRMKVPHIVYGCQDPNPDVAGQGLKELKKAGVKIEGPLLETECRRLNKRFITFHEKKRPYIILKWAQTEDGYLAREDYSSQWISCEESRTLVHHWRAREAAIMVGTKTALHDNPRLTARHADVLRQPLRVVLDRSLSIPSSHHLYDGSAETLIVTEREGIAVSIGLDYLCLPFDEGLLEKLMHILYQREVQSLIVEGGSLLLRGFLKHGLWDEARVFEAPKSFGAGIEAPNMEIEPEESKNFHGDTLRLYIAESAPGAALSEIVISDT